MKTIQSLALSKEAVAVLASIPQTETSEFISQAIIALAEQHDKWQAMEAIKHFPKIQLNDTQSLDDVLQGLREEK